MCYVSNSVHVYTLFLSQTAVFRMEGRCLVKVGDKEKRKESFVGELTVSNL